MNQSKSPVGKPILAIVAVNSIFLCLNGLFMIADPRTWYEMVPGVVTTGFYNQHFIRDIGIVQLLLGVAFVAGCFRSDERLVLWGSATVWLIAHAILHLWEVAVGICGPSALLRDFPAVMLPALIGIVATISLRIK
jgi:uncharacterized protein YjeT (DUF2065 family)